ncbi:MAG: hypothetical protein V4724_23030 [Pseudomonadota bacterium]
MTSSKTTLCAAALAVFALAGCGNNASEAPAPAPTSAVPVLAEGALLGYAGGDTAPAASAFINKEGKGYIALSADGDGGASVLHVTDNGKARRVPGGAAFVTLAMERSQPVTLLALDAKAAGSYTAMVGGKPASFTLAADGTLSAGASDCKLSGKVDFNSSYGGARGVTLNVSACGSVAAGSYSGVALASNEIAPAALQLIAENGSSVIDLLAYR